MKHLTDLEKWKLLAQSNVNQAAVEFGDQSAEEAKRSAERLGIAYLVNVISHLGTDAGSDLLRSLPPDLQEEILSNTDSARASSLKKILAYPPGTAGALMATEFLSIPIDATIGQVTDYLRALSQHKRGKISYIYVVDANDRLEGVIQIRDLVFHSPDTSVRKILKSPVIQVETGMSQMDVARLLQRHRYLGLPVVDAAQKLVGVISADNAMQIFEDEAADDIAKIVGSSAEEIRAHSAKKILRLRLPWLSFNILGGLLCAFISGAFQNDIQTTAALFLFVPLVLGLSESTGVQGATIMVRNLAMGDSGFRKLNALFVSEALAGVFIGVICGAVVGVVASFWQGNSRIGGALAASMSLAIILSALIGLFLPLLFKKLKIDPAVASGPLVLAICDIQTLLVYFNLSGHILRM